MADKLLEELTANTAPATSDILYLVDDPEGTPLGQKITLANLLGGIAGDVVFNENSGDYDFRVESNGDANALKVGGTEDSVGVGMSPIALDAYKGGKLQVSVSGGVNSLCLFNDTAVGLRIYNSTAAGASSGGVCQLLADITPTSSGDRLGVYAVRAIRTGTTDNIAAKMDVFAGEAWDADSSGSYMVFSTVPIGVNSTTATETLRLSNTECVFNEGSNDQDFRIESNDNANALIIDAGLNVVSVGAAATAVVLNNAGILQVTAPTGAYPSITGYGDTPGGGIISANTGAAGASSGGVLSMHALVIPSAADQKIGALAYRGYRTGTTLSPSAQVASFSEEAWDATHSGGYLNFQTVNKAAVALTEKYRITAMGNFVPMLGALATNATDGFIYIPSCAGTPTGTPTAYTGECAIVWDSTNNKLYVYDGGWVDTT